MTSTPTPSLAAALAKVQAELPKLERDRTVEVTQKNGGTYSYSYVTLARLSEVVLPLLAKHGLSFAAMPGLGADGKMAVRYTLLHESGEALTGEFPISGEGGIQMIGGRITYARRYCLAAVVGVAADEDDESRLADDGAPRAVQRAGQRPRRQASTPKPGEGAATVQRAASRPQASLPPLPGEEPPPPAAPPVGDDQDNGEPVTKPQLAKIGILFQRVGWTERADKLRASSTIVGRPIASSTELTKKQASTLIDALEMVAADDDPADRLTALLEEIRRQEGGQ
ncbi:ERF superfamily protein [Thermomonospora echinospora]|uniref:ERF superfamily protein n=1 Tax=Thermomonospora echinospora TaxID=1992 RepID=A0A1H6A846_9ACTN|nr:ERF family protein [Thermomonospora echinospora]SEG44344.1 ERF superfamily protein [Thermomonospora echinospora]